MENIQKNLKHLPLNRRKFIAMGISGLGAYTIIGGLEANLRSLLQEPKPLAPTARKPIRLLSAITSLLNHQSPNVAQMDRYLDMLRTTVFEKTAGELVLERWTPELERENNLPRIHLSSPIIFRRSVPGVNVLGALPPHLSSEKKLQWLLSDEVETQWAELYRPMGLRPLAFGFGGSTLAIASRREIVDLGSLKGLVAGATTHRKSWLNDLGINEVKVQQLKTLPELLNQGQIHLSLPLPHSVHRHLATHRLVEHYYIQTWTHSVLPYELVMLPKTWNSLPADMQRILREASRKIASILVQEKLSIEQNAFKMVREEAPTLIRSLPEGVLAEFNTRTQTSLVRSTAGSGAANELLVLHSKLT